MTDIEEYIIRIEKDLIDHSNRLCSIEDVIDDCCSIDTIKERIKAHTTLNDVLDRLKKIDDSMEQKLDKLNGVDTHSIQIEQLNKSIDLLNKVITKLDTDNQKFKGYIMMIVGAGLVIELIGVPSFVKQLVGA